MSFNSFFFFLFFISIDSLFAQITIRIVNSDSEPLENATIKKVNAQTFAITDKKGEAVWNAASSNENIEIKYIGYHDKIHVLTNESLQVITLSENISELAAPEIVANWARPNSFIVHTTIDAKELEKKQIVQDVPFLIQNLPSSVSTSDAGNGIGYSGIRIRGLDPTQINVLVNGIPFNDAESQGVFWVDMPDIIASASEIQVQRGVGLSGSGQVAFGSSILINTNRFNASPFLHFESGLGSYKTLKSSIEAGTGTLKNNWNVRGRLSYIKSNGYIDRASSNLWSGNLSISNINAKRSLRFHYFDGLERTYQAWYGVPVQYIYDQKLRTYNAAGTEKADGPYENQIDHYRQSHFQLLHTEKINGLFTLNNTIHCTPGNGYYEEYKADQKPEEYSLPTGDKTDLVRRKLLNSYFYGSIHGLHYKSNSSEYQVGTAWNIHAGRHYGEVLQTGKEVLPNKIIYYDNDALKSTFMFFSKGQWNINRLTVAADLQYRKVTYSYENENTQSQEKIHLDFFNPKLAFTYSLNNGFQFFGLIGIAHREPNREDYIKADDQLPKVEKLTDNETGIRWTGNNLHLEQNVYWMKYKNQLIPTGKLNDVGAYIRSNVLNSYRLGSETSVSYRPVHRLSLSANITISQNRTLDFTEYIDNWDTGGQESIHHKNKPIAFSPDRICNILMDYNVFKHKNHSLSADFALQSISKQYLDGTGNRASLLKGYEVGNAGIFYSINKSGKPIAQLHIRCNNIFNKKYESNGWIYRFNSPSYNPVSDDPYSQSEAGSIYSQKGLFPQAGRNWIISMRYLMN